jgi:hypothetical protein
MILHVDSNLLELKSLRVIAHLCKCYYPFDEGVAKTLSTLVPTIKCRRPFEDPTGRAIMIPIGKSDGSVNMLFNLHMQKMDPVTRQVVFDPQLVRSAFEEMKSKVSVEILNKDNYPIELGFPTRFGFDLSQADYDMILDIATEVFELLAPEGSTPPFVIIFGRIQPTESAHFIAFKKETPCIGDPDSCHWIRCETLRPPAVPSDVKEKQLPDSNWDEFDGDIDEALYG